uniref:Phosphate-binding protein n=1 Tax=uncultured beta proteobacterium TaxID=86027 RepID=H5SNZ8_9PROT|nr:phosphate transport system substrate-binding protein [uncultured beta proteobacterium]
MKLRNSLSLVATLTVASIVTTPVVAFAAEKIVKIDGSSTVYPVTEAVAEEFQIAQRGKVKITVGISGTGGGFKKFCRGETDISNASRPILESEMKACAESGIQYIELPVAFDALTVVIHPKNTWAEVMTVAELKKMWEPEAQGVITNWKQVSPRFPDRPLKLAGAGSDSGTFDYFTEAIVGKAKSSRGDYLASEDDNVVVQFVGSDENAIGYFGLAYYLENKDKLKAVQIKKDEQSPAVAPSIETVNNGTYQPLSRPIFIYVNAKAAKEKPEVREFVAFYLKHAGKLAKEVGYVNLPDRAYELAMKNFQAMKTGTVFGGHAEVGVRVEELLAREAKQ